MFNFKNKSSKYLFLGVLFLVIVGGSFVFPKSASASIMEGVARVLGWASWPFAMLCGKLVVLVIGLVVQVAQYNEFINSSAVTKGWMIVRDICNMFFILLLLLVAFSTVMGVKKYHYKAMLGRILLFAILINFSKMICGLFIDFAQVIMMTFVNAFKDTAAGNLTTALGINRMLGFGKSELGDVNDMSLLTAVILAVVLLGITLVVVTVMLLVLVFRIIMIWIFVVLSPLAFLMAAFPAAKEQMMSGWVGQWWKEFSKYVMIGPILAFFLWLSLTIMATSGDEGMGASFKKTSMSQDQTYEVDTRGVTEGTTGLTAAISDIGSSDRILSFVIAIAMLVGGLMATQQMGGVVGNIATKIPGAAAKWSKEGSKTAALWTGRKADLLQMGFQKHAMGVKKPWSLRPSIMKEAYKKRAEEVERRDFGMPRAEMVDKMFSVMSMGKEKTNYGDRQNLLEIKKLKEEFVGVEPSELVNRFKKEKDPRRRAAITWQLYEETNDNDVLEDLGYGTKAEGRQRFFKENFAKEMGEDYAYNFASEMSEISMKKGVLPGAGLYVYDETLGRKRPRNQEEHEQYLAVKAAQTEPQRSVRDFHRLSYYSTNSLVHKDKEGNEKKITVDTGPEKFAVERGVGSFDDGTYEKNKSRWQQKSKMGAKKHLYEDAGLSPHEWADLVVEVFEGGEDKWNKDIKGEEPDLNLIMKAKDKLKQEHPDWTDEKALTEVMEDPDAGRAKFEDIIGENGENYEKARKILKKEPQEEKPEGEEGESREGGGPGGEGLPGTAPERIKEIENQVDNTVNDVREDKRKYAPQAYKLLVQLSGGNKEDLIDRLIDFWNRVDRTDYRNASQVGQETVDHQDGEANKLANQLLGLLGEERQVAWDVKEGDTENVDNTCNDIIETGSKDAESLEGLESQLEGLTDALRQLQGYMGDTSSAKEASQKLEKLIKGLTAIKTGEVGDINRNLGTNYEKQPVRIELTELMNRLRKDLRLFLGGVRKSVGAKPKTSPGPKPNSKKKQNKKKEKKEEFYDDND